MMRRLNIPVRTGGPTDVDAWWNLPRSRDESAGYSVPIPPDATWLALDPGVSSPHASIAIDLPGTGPTILTPGAVLPIPERCTPIAMWNPLHALTINGGVGYLCYPANALAGQMYGRASLVCGDDTTLTAWLAYANRVKAAPKVGAIVKVALVPFQMVVFPSINLKGWRISAIPGDAAGSWIAVPADFSASFQRCTFNLAGNLIAQGDALDVSAYPVTGLGVRIEAGAGTTFTPVTYGGSRYSRHLEVENLTPSYASGYYLTALAGTGVGTAIVEIEGY